VPKTYYVNPRNGWQLVKAALDKRGWKQLPVENKSFTRFGLKWVERTSDIDYNSHSFGQLVCHIPNTNCIVTKLGLLKTIRETFCFQQSSSAVRIPTPWLSETYEIDSPADCAAALKAEEEIEGIQSENGESGGGIWIYKPSCMNRGRGVYVLQGKEGLRELFKSTPSTTQNGSSKQLKQPSSSLSSSSLRSSMTRGIVQKYLTDPLLVKGFKFDVRCYLLVARNDPTYLAFYHPGYFRMTLKPYTLDPESLQDVSIHLTNAAVQKKDPKYQEMKEFQVQIYAMTQLIAVTSNFYSTFCKLLYRFIVTFSCVCQSDPDSRSSRRYH
jgi:hypothetical protein